MAYGEILETDDGFEANNTSLEPEIPLGADKQAYNSIPNKAIRDFKDWEKLKIYLNFQYTNSPHAPSIDVKTLVNVARLCGRGISRTEIIKTLNLDVSPPTIQTYRDSVLKAIRMIVNDEEADRLGILDLPVSKNDLRVRNKFIFYRKIPDILKDKRIKKILDRNPNYRYLLDIMINAKNLEEILISNTFNFPATKELKTTINNFKSGFYQRIAGLSTSVKNNGREIARALLFAKFKNEKKGWEEAIDNKFILESAVIILNNEEIYKSGFPKHLKHFLNNTEQYSLILEGQKNRSRYAYAKDYFMNLKVQKVPELPLVFHELITRISQMEDIKDLIYKLANQRGVKPSTVQLELQAGIRFIENCLLYGYDHDSDQKKLFISREADINKIFHFIETEMSELLSQEQ